MKSSLRAGKIPSMAVIVSSTTTAYGRYLLVSGVYVQKLGKLEFT